MKITFAEFNSQLLGARLVDEHKWRAFNMEKCLWTQFAFDDDGCTYIPAERRHKEWINVADREI